MIIDTHCHYNMEPLFSGKPGYFTLPDDSQLSSMYWSDHWKNAQLHGVTASIVVGTTIDTTQRAIKIAQQEERLFAALGIHPTHTHSNTKLDKDLPHSIANGKLKELVLTGTTHLQKTFAQMIADNPKKVIAIGETGLDFFRLPSDASEASVQKQVQIEYLKTHLLIAREHNLVPILHVRDKNTDSDPKSDNAYWQTLEILKQVWTKGKPFILHCVSGPIEYVQQALEHGAYVGVAGNVTYKSADAIRDIVRLVPEDKVLIETDAPFLPPQTHRGEVCEPWMISHTAKFLQVQMNLSTQQLLENTHSLFSSI